MVEPESASPGGHPTEDVLQPRGATTDSGTSVDRLVIEPRGLADWLTDLDARLFEPPHTFQEVLSLVVARMSASWGDDESVASTSDTE
jgi:hypothetical protein